MEPVGLLPGSFHGRYVAADFREVKSLVFRVSGLVLRGFRGSEPTGRASPSEALQARRMATRGGHIRRVVVAPSSPFFLKEILNLRIWAWWDLWLPEHALQQINRRAPKTVEGFHDRGASRRIGVAFGGEAM